MVAEPITDPAEQAALDEQRRRAREDGQSFPVKEATAASLSVAASRLLELSRSGRRDGLTVIGRFEGGRCGEPWAGFDLAVGGAGDTAAS